VRLRVHRELLGKPKTLSVVRKADRWYAHVSCELADAEALAGSDPALRAALDVGVEALGTLHTGERLENCRAYARGRARLIREQRALARKCRGSKRRAKQVAKVARAHLKVEGGPGATTCTSSRAGSPSGIGSSPSRTSRSRR